MATEPQPCESPAELDVWTPGHITYSTSVPDRHDATEPKDNS